MARETSDTVSKCPACGTVSRGFPARCPECRYEFTAPDKHLPVMREATQEFDPRAFDAQAGTGRRVPRHIAVPVLAGLLLAIIVVVFVRLGVHEDTGEEARLPTTNAATESPPAPVPARAADVVPEVTAAAVAVPDLRPHAPEVTMPRLGPEEQRLVPIAAKLYASYSPRRPLLGPDTARLEELLTDTRTQACLFPARKHSPAAVEFIFERSARLSHIAVSTACANTATAPLSVTIISEDGTRRPVQLDPNRKRHYVDLAGAWSSRLWFVFETPAATGAGIAEVDFFAFEE